MKKAIILVLLANPFIAFSQAINMSSSTTIPLPKLAEHPNTVVENGKTRKKNAVEIAKDREGTKVSITIGGTVTGGTVIDGAVTGGTTNGNKTTGGTITGGTTINGTNDGGTTYDPFSGGITTGGKTINGKTTGGLTIGGISTKDGTNPLVTTGATTTFGTTTGGITFGGVTKYSAWVLNTNFTIPLVRVNFLVNKPQNSTNSLASTSFFNSVGAGINISLGELDVTKDIGNNNTAIAFYNHIGFAFGFLFAANSSSGSTTTTNSTTTPTTNASTTSGASTTTNSQSSTIFALVAGVSILNFQVGAGYELGSLTAGQRRGFLAISYAIPVSTLINGGYKILGVNKLKLPQ
ncbi:hypothetical protein [Mucilaginibacter sp. FT3.2]|uniref:hypothetical protein n=1 Tax=Mucilaginibacter sp. FT3.2 TaxID=2723090 RepID=UPI00160C8808|nr:hypothetical protein [Mucilaginibacter sp. FT3.2]MBB6234013.1 hypothetical protein [Mucilaginibacter sp. FT3.2]